MSIPGRYASEWRGYNQTQISYHPPKQGPEGLTEPESLLDCVYPVSPKIRIRFYINDYGLT